MSRRVRVLEPARPGWHASAGLPGASRGCRGMIGPARWNPGPVVCGPMLRRCGRRRGPWAARRACGGVGGAVVPGGAAV